MTSGSTPPITIPEAAQRDKLELIGRMATSVVHEIRNPLATIVATAQSLLAFCSLPGIGSGRQDPQRDDGVDRPSAEQFREDLELLLSEARRAGDIVGNLLSFARQSPSESRPVYVPEVVRRSCSLCRLHLGSADVRIQEGGRGYPTARSDGWVNGSENQLQQVLINLIDNAAQAIAATGVGGEIRVSMDGVDGEWLQLSVEDTGPGIPPDARGSVFDAFFTTKPPDQGTGLGLYICAAIIRAHGGRLTVEDCEGGGARFTVLLPLLDEAAVPTPRALETRPAASVPPVANEGEITAPPRRVLLVDDEAGILRIVARFLRRHGFTVDEALTGSAAVEAIEREQYDAVISDLRMPDVSGEELFGQVKRERPDLAARFVFTSGDTMRATTVEFLQMSGCPYLQKPYELQDLVRVLNTTCARDRGKRSERISA